ncbi:hypothetical protein ACJX0J_010084, partial [Zea mays]
RVKKISDHWMLHGMLDFDTSWICGIWSKHALLGREMRIWGFPKKMDLVHALSDIMLRVFCAPIYGTFVLGTCTTVALFFSFLGSQHITKKRQSHKEASLVLQERRKDDVALPKETLCCVEGILISNTK